ncbi:MAG: 50S ribosomal protein L25 [Desulfomonile sp.]|jgi:large subunit ribosomal protein L25
MNKITLSVDKRFGTGKGQARRLRAAGKVPGVLYGKKTEPIKLTLEVHEFQKALDEARTNPIFDLKIRDNGGTISRSAILKERQFRPMDGSIVHLDFLEVLMDESIEVSVPIEFQGKPVGLDKGGLFQISTRELRISCFPDDIPTVITVDVSSLDVGHSIHVSDIALPPKVSVVQELGVALASCAAPKKPEEEGAAEESAESETAG